ncbi:rhoptry-associated protein 2, putative [Plasmodium ovale]|uniref:Rhoptry-associated protein 2, putative n=2 Tax=Plasmodium ovale TaxID=36330 RepID=A0A1C3KKE0_PLAOA|nr:rhoptry-associated protein 2, putative [Plasmodium ovale]
MNVKLLIAVFVFFCLHNVGNAYHCSKPLYSMNIMDFSLMSMITAHSSTRKSLGMWMHFFFNHFSNGNDAIKYMEKINVNTLEDKEHSCFTRAFNMFLIHVYAKDIKTMSNSDTFESYFKNLLRGISPEVTTDFFDVIGNTNLMNHIDGIILQEADISNLKKDIRVLGKSINKASRKSHASFIHNPNRNLGRDIRSFRREYLVKDDPSVNNQEIYAVRDYNLLAYLGVTDKYYSSDITLPARGTSIVIDKRKRLGLKKRSTSLYLLGPHSNNTFFAYCEKDGNEDYFGSVDDLLASFFSVIKTKMIFGHKRFLREFDYSLFHKTYKMPNLKGLRFLKSLFRKKNLENFIDMYANLMSTELDFLTEDFAELFEITINCHAREFANRAGDNYYAIKEKYIAS